MTIKAFIHGLALLFMLLPAGIAAAYGGGTQDEKYPQIVDTSEFIALAEGKLAEELESLGETRRHELELVRAPQPMHCPPGKLVCEVTIPQQLRYNGSNPVYVTVYVDNELFRRAICYYRVNVYDIVLVAVHDLPVEHVIKPDDVKLEERRLKNRGDATIFDVAAVVGKVPARVIKAGTPLTENMLQAPMAVETGAPVKIVSSSNGIRISTEGVAMQRGRVGQIIRVRNLNSGKVRRARVVDASTVEIV